MKENIKTAICIGLAAICILPLIIKEIIYDKR